MLSTAMRLCSTKTSIRKWEGPNRLVSGTSNCRSACPGSPRQERCLRSVKPNISRGPATTGTAFTHKRPVHEFVAEPDKAPDELWIVRINPQQWPELPKTNAEIQDRQNELMGNLSLHKELDFILKVNAWRDQYKGNFADDQKM